jgi:nitrite reductase/ring-hydroxylating ferredoxin subunit
MGTYRPVARLADLPEGHALAVQVEGRTLALFNVDGEIRAVAGTCAPHGAHLAQGVIQEGRVLCPRHGAALDLATGTCAASPAAPAATTFPVRVEGGQILVAC